MIDARWLFLFLPLATAAGLMLAAVFQGNRRFEQCAQCQDRRYREAAPEKPDGR